MNRRREFLCRMSTVLSDPHSLPELEDNIERETALFQDKSSVVNL